MRPAPTVWRKLQACSGSVADDVVVNVQGDEPLIPAAVIDAVADLLERSPDCVMATAAHPIRDAAEFFNPNVVKVVTDRQRARAVLLACADSVGTRRICHEPDDAAAGRWARAAMWGCMPTGSAFLARFPDLPPDPLEELERLEQLRALAHGYRIAVVGLARGPSARRRHASRPRTGARPVCGTEISGPSRRPSIPAPLRRITRVLGRRSAVGAKSLDPGRILRFWRRATLPDAT